MQCQSTRTTSSRFSESDSIKAQGQNIHIRSARDRQLPTFLPDGYARRLGQTKYRMRAS